MSTNTERILKGDDVEISGCLQLQNTAPGPATPSNSGAPLTEPKAAVVENTPDFVIIEVLCSCGRKTRVRCDYTSPAQTAENKT